MNKKIVLTASIALSLPVMALSYQGFVSLTQTTIQVYQDDMKGYQFQNRDLRLIKGGLEKNKLSIQDKIKAIDTIIESNSNAWEKKRCLIEIEKMRQDMEYDHELHSACTDPTGK